MANARIGRSSRCAPEPRRVNREQLRVSVEAADDVNHRDEGGNRQGDSEHSGHHVEGKFQEEGSARAVMRNRIDDPDGLDQKHDAREKGARCSVWRPITGDGRSGR